MGAEKIRLIYLIGSGRSGSTVVASTLSAHTHTCNLGEVYNFAYFFGSAEQYERRCECGERLLDCSYWHAVRKKLSASDPAELIDIKSRDGTAFENANMELFRAIHGVSNANAYIDSSKRVYRLRLMRAIESIEVTTLHVIRDPRAYGYSSKLTEMKKGAGRAVYFSKVFRWLIKNLAIYLGGMFQSRHLTVRYEDFVKNPDRAMNTISQVVGIEYLAAGVDREASHQFSGNSGVFSQGAIELKHDRRFIEGLTTGEWWLSTLICLPLLLLLRYPLRRAGYQ